MREYLQQTLPEYMVPSAFVVLEALPITPNGKVDRKALPVPDASHLVSNTYVAPRNPTEELLASIFAQVLGLPRVGIHEDFFSLGGHSLLATRVTSRIREALNVELPLRALFSAPSVAGLARELERMRPGPSLPPLTRMPRQSPLPLSFAQQRLWLEDQMAPGGISYNMPLALHLRGRLDTAALRQTFEALLARHESLRTSFPVIEGQPTQHIHSSSEWTFPMEQLGHLPEHERMNEALRLAKEEARIPFELSKGPLLRARLLQLHPDESVLLVTMHHIISDGWSLNTFFSELGALYAAFSAQAPSPLEPLPLQYVDYSLWQRQWLQGEALEQLLSFWKQQLADLPPLELPTDRPRPAVQTNRGAYLLMQLSPELSASLRSLCQREGVTPFMALLATFQVLLSRYSGQRDFAVGSPIAGRTRTELEDLIGFFVNTLVLRARLQPGASFRQHLASVQRSTLSAYEYQDIPFEKLVEVLQPQRDPSRSPLFQVMFALQNAPAMEMQLSGLTMEPLETLGGSSRFDLEMNLTDSLQGFHGNIMYNTDLFDEVTVARMATHFQVLLEGIVANPDAPLASLPLLNPEERQRLLVEWNSTSTSYPADSSIHSLFSLQASLHPDSLALEFDSERLTYSQLEARSNQLAHHLRSLGVGPDCFVALFLERSPSLFVSMLAALKAGGAYLPLDTSYPQERLALMLRDARPRLLLTSEALASSLPASDVPTVLLDSLSLSSLPSSPPPSSTLPLHLAYAIYTSGSTGQPKGISIPHRAVVRLVRDTTYHSFSSDERIAQLSNASFDAATFEIWGALLNGGTLVGLPRDVILSPSSLAEQLASKRVSSLFLTTALFNQVAQHAPTAFSHLRSVLFGGERVDPSSVRKVLQHGPPQRLLHVYGPTENTTYSTWHLIEHLPEDASNVPIGIPLSNSTAYVLDASLQPVPVGVPGELYVGGEGLARGYLFQPALTAERFVPHPFSASPGERLYRTGDVVRQLPSGAIDFVGRADTQVKIRGFRIEPGEVEAVLLKHSSVRECVVLAREDSPGDRRLVAYAVPHAGLTLEASALREYLQQTLPDYMVPSAFVVLEALPINPNGKVDRKALPVPDASQLTSENYVAPRDPTEELLASIFAQVLGLPRVGVHEDFFSLGGHSLLATRVTSRIREALQVELPLRALFSSPTVAGLAEHVKQARSASLPPLLPAPRHAPLPLSFAQQRIWLDDQLQPDSPSYNVPLAMRLSGSLDLAALESSLQELLSRHESLRTSFTVLESQPVQVIAPHLELSLPLVELSELPEPSRSQRLQELLTAEARKPFDLRRAPLLRCTLVRLSASEHVLLVTMHHIVTDGWSLDVFFRELNTLYAAFSSHQPSPLPALPLQYADFSLWQRQWLQGETLERQLSFWKQQLAGAPPVLELPTDFPRPAIPSGRGAVELIQLSPALLEALKKLSHQEGTSLFMTVLAAFQLLLGRMSGQEDICVGTSIANRTRTELEGLIGFFVNALALRTQLSGVPTFRELLRRVRASTLEAYAHQDVPFEQVVEAMQLRRDPRFPPLFQVKFNLQNMPSSRLSLPGLQMETLEGEWDMARYDLHLFMHEAEGALHASLLYSSDLFRASTARRMLTHLGQLLEEAASRADAPLSSLSMLTPEERQQVLVEWNDTRADFPREATLHSLVQAQAQRTPEATALVSESGSLTYRQLAEASTRLALHLRSLGVGPGTRVALCIERSPEMLVSLLAILRAGAAWVPLDPEYPAERLAFMLEDSDATLLVTRSALLQALPTTRAQVLRLDSLDALNALPPAPQGTVLPEPEATSPAYVIYTSGSTGRPKGVQVAHRAAVNHLHWRQREFPMGPQDAFLQKASFSFDISVWEMFAPLLAGARLVLARPGGQREPEYLAQLVMRHGITHLHFGPAPLSAFLETPDVERCQSLRFVFCGGEPLTHELHARFLSKLSAQLVHQYGPTEACIDCTAWVCPPHAVSALPIGRPISNTQAYVVDASLRPVPVGVPGELLIGGEGVALGYLGRPELTSERFITDPFSTTPGARLYRTGDKVRWLEDGTLEFLGRFDSQVKLRGFRIELGEIQSALRAHPSVREAIVVVRQDSGDKRLAAYVVPTSPRPPGEGRGEGGASPELHPADLRDFLKQSLPEYMVPSAFVVLEALPLTPNGKVDTKALPLPELHAQPASAMLAPRDELELRLTRLWEEVLGVQPVGVRGDFFELGGHSLLAVRLMARVRETTGRELPLATLVRAPTVELLAALLRQESPLPWSPLVPLGGGGDKTPLFLVHPVGGNVFCYTELARQLGSERPIFGLQAQGLDGLSAPLSSVEEMAAHYVESIRSVQPSGPYLLGGWSMGGVIAYEMAHQLRQRGEEVELVALIDSYAARSEALPELTPAEAAVLFTQDLLGTFGAESMPEWEQLESLEPEAVLARVLEVGERSGALPPGVGLEQLRTLLRVFESNLRASQRYTARPSAQRLLLLKAGGVTGQPEDGGWTAVGGSGLERHVLPGGHHELLRTPLVQRVAEYLREALAPAQRRALQS
ncbi:amino acid adenylation domain-containing protein [Archangium gephyra]|uniref:amino acid adenylation domain-containing protein n=1 Tax=Archangium gephyra TaxID=48 RepID=UPI0023ED9B62|nr:non-ribosomal peptide synthetase [Archangium gephyra]